MFCNSAIFLLLALLTSGCAQVQAEAQATLDDAILAREMNRDGIFKAYERCNDLIEDAYEQLVDLSKDATTTQEALHWLGQAAKLVSVTKRELLSKEIVKKLKAGEVDFKLDCFREFKLDPYVPDTAPAMA